MMTDPTLEAAGPLQPLQKVNPNVIGPIIFTYWERTAINEARHGGGKLSFNRTQGATANKPKPPPEEREITLSGIAYTAPNDWTVWLNGKRLVPGALLPEMLALDVHSTYIEMRWMDDYTGRIYPIRLRPHQRFNLDSHVFLPVND
jgi:hypothetical protein